MAGKKIARDRNGHRRVVVSEAYLNLLIEKAEMLDEVFPGHPVTRRVREAQLRPDDFKRVEAFTKRFDKVDTARDEIELQGCQK